MNEGLPFWESEEGERAERLIDREGVEQDAASKMFMALRKSRKRRGPPELRSYNPFTGEYELGPRKEPPNPFDQKKEPEDEPDPSLLRMLQRRRKSHPDFEPFRFNAVVRYMKEESDLAYRLRLQPDRLLLEVNMDAGILAESPHVIARIKAEIIKLRLDPPTGLVGCSFHATQMGKR